VEERFSGGVAVPFPFPVAVVLPWGEGIVGRICKPFNLFASVVIIESGPEGRSIDSKSSAEPLRLCAKGVEGLLGVKYPGGGLFSFQS
jgi:hypothetical protein